MPFVIVIDTIIIQLHTEREQRRTEIVDYCVMYFNYILICAFSFLKNGDVFLCMNMVDFVKERDMSEGVNHRLVGINSDNNDSIDSVLTGCFCPSNPEGICVF